MEETTKQSVIQGGVKAEVQGDVQRELLSLEEAIVSLDKKINELETILNPILGEETLREEKAQEGGVLVPLAGRIRDSRIRITFLFERIEDIINRVGL